MPRRQRMQSAAEAALAILPKPHEVKKKRLEELITDMSFRAAAAAEEAWKKVKAAGCVGTLLIPADGLALELAKRFFLSGYGLALLDHTMEAVKRMKAAADLDQEDEARRLVV